MFWEGDFWSTVETKYVETAILLVPPIARDRFNNVIADVSDALNEALIPEGRTVDRIISGIAPSDEGWRERLERRLGLGPTNQARVRPARDDVPRCDGLIFRSRPEVAVYDALKRAREALPSDESLLIAPNAGIRVRESTWEVDFLIAYRGRAGVIEVDGPHHRGRRAVDLDRERVLEDHGIAAVERITVEDTDEPAKLDALIQRLLRKLRER